MMTVVLSLILSLGLFLFSSAAWAQTPNRGNLGDEVLYYISVDRFADGIADNNIPQYAFPLDPNLDPETLAYHQVNRLLIDHTYDPTHRYIKLYWGGDLEGIIQKLDYLQDLGITQLVLSGIQDSANGLIYSPQSRSSYLHEAIDPEEEEFSNFYAHAVAGFNAAWLKDWFEIDEHFRNPQDQQDDRFRVMQHLLHEAGERGIGIILEWNLNHASPYRTSADYAPFEVDRYETWFVDNGAIYRHGEKVANYWDGTTQQINPEGWFHDPISIDYNRPTAEMLENGPIGGLPDLNQENPVVAQYLLEAAEFWLTFNQQDYAISGFYVPSIYNINVHFWQAFESAVLAINPDAILIADYENGGYRNKGTIEWYEQTQDYALVNYDLSVASRRFFGRDRGWDGRTIVLRENLVGKAGQYYNYSAPQRWLHYFFNPSESLEVPRHALDVVAPEDAQAWVNFVEIAELPRLLTYYPQMSQESYASAIKFLFASAGVPMLLYGVETGLAVPYHIEHQSIFGMGGKPFNQQMMIWPDDRGWENHLYEVTRAMTHLRQAYPVLRYGTTRFLFPVGSRKDKDIFMLREFENCPAQTQDCAQVLYVYSTEGGEFSLNLDLFDPTQVHTTQVHTTPIQTIKDVESGVVITPTEGFIAIQLKPEASKVLVLNPNPSD
jgi:glycosidase